MILNKLSYNLPMGTICLYVKAHMVLTKENWMLQNPGAASSSALKAIIVGFHDSGISSLLFFIR